MNRYTLTFAQLGVTPVDVCAAMGYKDVPADSETMALIEKLLPQFDKLQPCCSFRLFEGRVGSSSVEIGGEEFLTGKTIATILRGAEHFAVFIATAGAAFETIRAEFSRSGEILEQYVVDAIGSATAMKTGQYICQRIEEQVVSEGEKTTNSFSPGHCKWSVSDQPKIFNLLGSEFNCGVTLTDSFLMYPVKSISGIIGFGHQIGRKQNSCDICPLVNCFRRNTTHHS